jgi:transcriptional regulator with GAF, ATPase, and Fis domain
MERLQSYMWPGNIRQLQNVLERAVLQTEGSLITAEQIDRMLIDEADMPFQRLPQPQVQQTLTVVPQPPISTTVASFSPAMNAAENPVLFDRRSGDRKIDQNPDKQESSYRPYLRVDSHDRDRIMEILSSTGGNQTRAAELLGLTVRQLRYRLRKLA